MEYAACGQSAVQAGRGAVNVSGTADDTKPWRWSHGGGRPWRFNQAIMDRRLLHGVVTSDMAVEIQGGFQPDSSVRCSACRCAQTLLRYVRYRTDARCGGTAQRASRLR